MKATSDARLFLIRFLHQTTTQQLPSIGLIVLFLIRFLHQTTTTNSPPISVALLFLIRFLHQTTTVRIYERTTTMLFLIRFLHQTTTEQLLKLRVHKLFLIRFLHQTTTSIYDLDDADGCSLLDFYIKPQRFAAEMSSIAVVPYQISTSNHNGLREYRSDARVVPYQISTSNHNTRPTGIEVELLFLIRFLHQTTTFFLT